MLLSLKQYKIIFISVIFFLTCQVLAEEEEIYLKAISDQIQVGRGRSEMSSRPRLVDAGYRI